MEFKCKDRSIKSSMDLSRINRIIMEFKLVPLSSVIPIVDELIES